MIIPVHYKNLNSILEMNYLQEKSIQSTIVDGGSGIMAKKFGVFCTKICYFIEENMTKNGPLVFRTVLCSKYDEKMGNYQKKTMR